jgi:hypothetical protein
MKKKGEKISQRAEQSARGTISQTSIRDIAFTCMHKEIIFKEPCGQHVKIINKEDTSIKDVSGREVNFR